jgi:hypothetical protein
MSDNLVPRVFLSGGLGNQLFQLAAGLRYSSSRVVVNVSQLSKPCELQDFMRFLEKKRSIEITIESSKPSLALQKAHNYLLRSKTWKKNSTFLKVMMKYSTQAIFFLAGVNPKNVLLDDSEFHRRKMNKRIQGELLIIGYFQQECVASVLRNDLNEFLDITYEKDSADSIGQYSSQLLVHIRRGDYASEERIGMLSMTYFQRGLSEFNRKYKTFSVALFTNGYIDQLELEGIAKFGKLIHADSDSAIEILAMMRKSENFLISNSTLSWWAAYLSTTSKKQVFVPMPWFRMLAEPVNLIPKSWIRLPAFWSQGNES